MFKVISWWDGGNQEEEIEAFNTIKEAKAFVEGLDGFYLIDGFGEEGYDILDDKNNLIERYV